MIQKKISSLILFVLTAAAVSSCARNSLTGRRQLLLVPDSQMNAMGAQAFTQIKQEEKVSTDPKMNAYVKCIASQITAQARKGSWEVVVFDSPTVNAFALPGGKIGVYTGLVKLSQNADQLAAVIGHEVAHVLAKHGAERVSENLVLESGLGAVNAAMANSKSRGIIMGALGLGAQFGVQLPHSRKHETESDKIGQKYMAQAGFDPAEAAKLWQQMAKSGGGSQPEIMSTHPAHSTRINNLSKWAASSEIKNAYEKAKKSGKPKQCRL